MVRKYPYITVLYEQNSNIVNLQANEVIQNFHTINKAGDEITFTFGGSNYNAYAVIFGESYIVMIAKAGQLYKNVVIGSPTVTLNGMSVKITGAGYHSAMCIARGMTVS